MRIDFFLTFVLAVSVLEIRAIQTVRMILDILYLQNIKSVTYSLIFSNSIVVVTHN